MNSILKSHATNSSYNNKARTFYWAIVAVVIILSLVFLSLVSFVKAATYYYISGPVNNVSSWKTGSNGTGTSPANFTTGGNTFIIWNSLGVVPFLQHSQEYGQLQELISYK